MTVSHHQLLHSSVRDHITITYAWQYQKKILMFYYKTVIKKKILVFHYKIVRIYCAANSIYIYFFLYKSLIMYSICKFFLLQRQCMFFTYTIMNHLVTEKHRNFEQEWACPKFQLWRHEFGESWLGICMSRDLFSIRTMYIYIGVWCEME